MKITHIQTSNFLGARAVDLELKKPVALFAGKNGAGKSSIQEAIRMALTGEPVRVGLKKDYPALLTEGADSGFAEVAADGVAYSIILPSGKGTCADANPALPFVLDAQRFARMDDKERRAFLFGLMGVKMDGPAIKDRMLAKGCDAAKVEQIMPIMRAGFDAANKEAAAKARDAKAAWKTATGGDTWGKDKAGKWQPAPLPEGADGAAEKLAAARAALENIASDLNAASQALGAINASAEQIAKAMEKRASLEAIHGNLQRYTDKLSFDESELAAWEQKVADCRTRAGVAQPSPKEPGQYLLRGLATVIGEFLALTSNYPEIEWPSDLINRAAVQHAEYVKLHGDPVGNDAGPDQEAIAKLPEYESALKLMRSAVENSKRNLEAAKVAGEQLKALEDLQSAGDQGAEAAARAKVEELAAKRKEAQADVERLVDLAGMVKRRADVKTLADKHHADVLAWADIADALAPDGIPGELLAEALGPINERLYDSAGIAEWPQVVIHSDMRITYGLRDYALVSESEKWRADAMIAEAVSFLSGVKLLVLDRFDVLDMKGREDLLYWLDGMAADGDIDTALIFGTLKALPALNFATIEAHWIDNGAAGQLKEAA